VKERFLEDGTLDFEDDNVMDLDDTHVPELIDSRDLAYEFLPREEGEGFVEELERRIDDRIAQLDEDEVAQQILDEVYDDEDLYDTGEHLDENEYGPNDGWDTEPS
jgi:hypothetical protein